VASNNTNSTCTPKKDRDVATKWARESSAADTKLEQLGEKCTDQLLGGANKLLFSLSTQVFQKK